jgi:hypothetical protein
MTAGAGFFVLFSTNRDEEQFWMTAGDALREVTFCKCKFLGQGGWLLNSKSPIKIGLPCSLFNHTRPCA